jgi:hypothetical protein
MTARHLRDAGLPPAVGYALLVLVFVGCSLYLFQKTEFAEPLYLLSALALIGQLSETRRNDFLKICFRDDMLKRIRIAENVLTVLPFLLFLAYKQLFYAVLVLFLVTVLLALVQFRTVLYFTIPTPFYKKPFEFLVGFRNTFYLIAAAYALTGIAVSVGNFNLGIFAMLFVFAIALTYYGNPEAEYFVWIHNNNAGQFLLNKIKTALWYALWLALPVALTIGIFFPENMAFIALFMGIGMAFLACMIAAKYAAYPYSINIAQAVLLSFNVWFPPLLLVFIPYFFFKSQKRLRYLLP